MWRAVNRAFNWAINQELIDRNPARGVEKPSPPHREDFVTEEEYDAVLAHSDEVFRDLVIVAWECGPRPQELLAVEARHVELDKARWHFPPPEGKKNRRRFVYMTPEAQVIVARLVRKHPSGPIFRNSKGRPWTPFSVNCRFQRLEEEVGRKLCLYLFRHSYITGKLVAGVDSAIVKDLAGHVDAQMINRVYGHVAENWEFMADQANRKSS
jgi:integrase